MEDIIDLYCTAWSNMPDDQRSAILQRSVTKDIEYTDPKTNVLGISALSEHIRKVVAARPGSMVVRTSQIDHHHSLARFGWHVRLADGTTLPEGIDVVQISEDDGKLSKIIGFFGPLKPNK